MLQPLLSVDFPGITQVIQNIRTLVVELNAVEDEAQRQVRRCRGRPKVVITEPELRNLLELQFTQVEISRLYGCSPRTIRRRISSYGLQEFIRPGKVDSQFIVTARMDFSKYMKYFIIHKNSRDVLMLTFPNTFYY